MGFLPDVLDTVHAIFTARNRRTLRNVRTVQIAAITAQLKEICDLLRPDDIRQPYIIAPTQAVPIARLHPEEHRDLVPMRWGLICNAVTVL